MKFKRSVICVLLLFLFFSFVFIAEGRNVSAEEYEYNKVEKAIDISYDMYLNEEAQITSNYLVTKTSHWVGNWGSYDGYKFVPANVEHNGGIKYDYLGEENGQSKIFRFYTMINNFEKGTVKVTFTVDKLSAGELIDLSFSFYDVISKKQVGFGDLTSQYNDLELGKNKNITTYIDANYIGSVDSLLINTKADTQTASYVLTNIKMEFGSTQISTADGYFRGLDNGFNMVFDKLTRKNVEKDFLMMPINLFSTEFSSAYDSGTHGNYGFNNGKIIAHNDDLGEYLAFEKGPNNGDNISGIWSKFPLDVLRKKVNVRFTFMKVYEGNCAEIKFEFMSKAGKDSRSIVITNDSGLPDGKGLKDVTSGEWVTVDIENFDISPIEEFDSLGIWVNLDGNDSQAIYLKNVSIYYDECGAERSSNLTESTLDGMSLSSTKNVIVESDINAREYLKISLNSEKGKTLTTLKPVKVNAGMYKAVISLKKNTEVSSDFTLQIKGMNNAQVNEQITTDLTEQIKNAPVGEWFTLETNNVELLNEAINELRLSFSGEGEILLENVSLICTKEYLDPNLSLAVDNTLVRDFTALKSMGMEEYDFSLNTFPEIGNWSNTFSDLLSQGQKVVYEDGVPAMRIYRRTQEEIEQAKVDFGWPEGKTYVPATKSHFFMTAPINKGYVEISVTVKKDENFKETSEFSITGYTGKEPWYMMVNFTEDLASAPVGEWVTFTKTVYLPEPIDSIMVRVETRYEDSYLYLKDVKLTTKTSNTTGFYDASKPSDLTWNISADKGITSVKCNEVEVSSNDYTYENGIFTLKPSVLSTLDNGSSIVEISDGTNTVTIDLSISKVAPILSSTYTYKVNKKDNLVIELDTRNSGISFIELNGVELELDVDYTYDTETSKLTILNRVLSDLDEGEYVLNVKTRAGSATSTIIIEKDNNILLFVGIGAGVLLLACAAVFIIKKKRGV